MTDDTPVARLREQIEQTIAEWLESANRKGGQSVGLSGQRVLENCAYALKDLLGAAGGRSPVSPVEQTLPKRSTSELSIALRERAKYLTGRTWEAPATAAMMVETANLLQEAEERAAQAEASRAQLEQGIQQLEAELLMVKQFLNEPGTDPDAWVDGCLERVKGLAALVPVRPSETEP